MGKFISGIVVATAVIVFLYFFAAKEIMSCLNMQ